MNQEHRELVQEGLDKIPCPKCNEEAIEIIHAAVNIRAGWWCQSCDHFEKTIFRERKLA
jgi:phosphoribosyl-ATP pyrophosphohydrolase